MIPQCPVTAHAILQLIGCFHGVCLISLVLLGFRTGCRIDLFQLGDGKRRFLRILSFIGIIEINQSRIALLQFRNDQPHLQTPVTQMDIPDHIMPRITADPLDALPDHSRAKMSHVKRLRHIGAAVVNHNLLRRLWHLQPKLLISPHAAQIIPHESLRNLHIQKARRCRCHFRKNRTLLQPAGYILRDHKRRFMIFLRSCHSAVTLILAQIRSVGQRHLSQRSVISCRLKCFHHLF